MGKYVGVRMVDLTPARAVRTMEPVVVVQYADGELTLFQRLVDKELWLFRGADSGDHHELSTLVDRLKWKRRRASVEETSKNMAVSLSKMMAIRNGFHRTPCAPDDARYADFVRRFAYEPTQDQEVSFRAVAADMINNTRPMDRLVCGDVGFGKTEVAMRAIYRAALSRKQVALLAPTRVLALQHLRVLRGRMPDVNVQLLRGGGKADALKVKEQLRTGECQVVVGTHALLQPTVTFGNLGLLVVDEEQRFGVAHKEKLKAVSSGTDVLTLSATPIPRTLQMSLSGLRDLSLMNSPPKGRKEVNVTVGQEDPAVMRDAISREVARGGQVFAVVPFVRDVGPTAARLEELVPGLRVIEAHGQHDDLEDRIDAFSAGRADVLVATTVIENGVDMPNVNTILVLSADRFGMSALYQLRGRVGRSPRQAFAFFMTNTSSITVEAENRLTYLQTFTALGSGYDLSRRDMEMRGYGTIFGSDQSGTADVGLDLQAAILAGAVARLTKEHILSTPEARLALGGPLEACGAEACGQELPASDNLGAVSLWEAKLAEAVLNGARLKRPADALRAFFAASSVDELERLLDDWRAQLRVTAAAPAPASGGVSLDVLVERLVRRSQCRILARRLGVHEARRVGAHVFFASRAIDKAKWKPMTAVVPEGLASHVAFDVKPAFAGAAEGAAAVGTMGVICLRDAASHAGASVATDDDVAVMEAVLQLLQPLARYADTMLDAAVAECDPDKDKEADQPPPTEKDAVTDEFVPSPVKRIKRRAKAG